MRSRKHVLKRTKKYLSRPSPAIPANKHCGETRKGNDGLMYTSVSNYRGICRWVKSTGSKAKQVKKKYYSKRRTSRSRSRKSYSRKTRRKSRKSHSRRSRGKK